MKHITFINNKLINHGLIILNDGVDVVLNISNIDIIASQ